MLSNLCSCHNLLTGLLIFSFSELKNKSQQLDSAISKNQQLTIYAADVRQDIARVQQAAEMAEQESGRIKQRLLSQQKELQESNCHLNKRLEETLQENERLNTALQLCYLERDKMHILLSNKDLEVAKLKKEIVLVHFKRECHLLLFSCRMIELIFLFFSRDVHTLVTEQLISMGALSGKNCSSEDLNKMMQAVNRLHITIDGTNSTLLPSSPSPKEGVKGDGDGSRSRPICSSPTSSVNSSLYTSWQLMSDIMTPDQNPKDPKEVDRNLVPVLKEPSLKRDDDLGRKVKTPVGLSSIESTTNQGGNAEERKQSAQVQ